ncbi:MAG TPA: PKD domain-containing protein, partial [Planctomycetota bacterium]|nr:PKD domain-containing protein [Planctomycetota bacterium]
MRTWLCIAVVAIIIYSLGTMPPSSDTLLPAASAAPLPATVAFPREFTPLVRTAVEQKTHWKDPAKPLEVSLPAVFTEKTRVRCAGFEVAVSPQHARASEAEPLSDTALIYRDAFPGCDVRYECSQFKTEEFIDVKETTESIRRFSWSLAGGELQPRLTAAHTIEFCDADGTPRIRINAPEGKDANGRLLLPGKELCYELAGDELTLVADLTACRFPVVIDPTFASTGTMATARKAHRAERLQNGKVLVCGGYADNSFALNSAELYDPATGTFSATGSMNVARGNHISVMLNDGRVMVLAGSNTDFILTPHPQCEIYDPASGAWTLTDPQPNVYTATVLQDGRVLSSNLQLFDPLAGTWSPTGMFNVSHGELQFVTLTDGRVLAISVSAQEPCEVFNPITETWSVVGSLNAPHSRAPSVLLADGTVLILPQLGQPALTESFNPASGTWTVKTPALSTHSHLTRLLDGRVLATGNVNNTTGSLSEVYSPGTDRWIETSNLGRRGAHTSTLLSDGKVLITGGNIFDIFFVPGGTEGRLSASASARIYDPAAPDLTASASPVVVVVGESVSFTSLGTDLGGESLTYLWNFGDGTTSSQSTVTHAYQAGGLYPVVLTVTNTSGKYAEARYDI